MGISIQQGMGGGGLAAATQAEMEAASSTSVASSPGRQHFHPGHPKCWAYVTVSGGTPTLQTSYNITSITDTSVGRLTVTIATDFSSANWCPQLTIGFQGDANPKAISTVAPGTVAAGSVELTSGGAGAFQDPTLWAFAGYGDQA